MDVCIDLEYHGGVLWMCIITCIMSIMEVYLFIGSIHNINAIILHKYIEQPTVVCQ